MNPVPHPITASDAHEGIIPHLYLVMKHTQHCTCCGAKHHWSELYAQTFMRANWGYGKPIVNLRKLDWPKYNLPIEVRATPPTELPFCHDCYEPSLAHSSGILEPPQHARVLIGASLKPQVEPHPEPKPKPKPRKITRYTSAELAELLK